MQAENELTQIKLRKNENRLDVSGSAVVAFGVWSIIRAVMFFLTQPIDLIKALGVEKEVVELGEAFAETNSPVDAHFMVSGMILFMIFSYMTIAVLLRFYIGRSAILEARGLKKKSVLYIILAVFMSTALFLAILSYFNESPSDSANVIDTAFTSGLMDLISFLALVEMIIAAIRVRQLRKKLGIIIPRKNADNQVKLPYLPEEL